MRKYSLPRNVATIVMLFAFAACVETTAGLREKSPFFSATTQKGSREVAACVAEKWGSMNRRIAVLPRVGGESVTLGSLDDQAVVDIDDAKSSDNVRLYLKSGPWLGKDKQLRSVVEACI